MIVDGSAVRPQDASVDGLPTAATAIRRGSTLLRLQDVILATSIGSSTIYRKIAANQFPRPLRLGPGSVRWQTSEIIDWIAGLDRTQSTEAA